MCQTQYMHYSILILYFKHNGMSSVEKKSINPLKSQSSSSQYNELKIQFRPHRKHSVLYKDQSIDTV